LPLAPMQGGSHTASSIGMAVLRVCEAVKKKVLKLAQHMSNTSLKSASPENVIFADGKVQLTGESSMNGISITDILQHARLKKIEEKTTSLPNYLKQRKYAMNTHSAIFAEVTVDESLGIIRVTRVVSAVAGGRIINPKTARSQIIGGVVWGLSAALHEDTFMDHQFGRFINHDLAEYHIPVNADIPDIDVIFVKEDDDIVNPLGIKGLGEIGLVGVAPAIANAIYHATGKRVKDFPITLDKVMAF
jgi:xanthine dehydrogenase YagR molybdenum-binding subunit